MLKSTVQGGTRLSDHDDIDARYIQRTVQQFRRLLRAGTGVARIHARVCIILSMNMP